MHAYNNQYNFFKIFSFNIYINEWKKEILTIKKSEKTGFYKRKKIFNIDDIDVNKTLVSKKEPYGKNNSLIYFIGYNDNNVVRPLCLRLSKTTVYINEFNENKNTIIISLRVNDEQLFKKYSRIWKKVEKLPSRQILVPKTAPKDPI